MTQEVDAFSLVEDSKSFKTNCMKISKLICEAWINTETGKKFKKDILKKPLADVLEDNGISLPWDFVNVELDTASFNGSIEPDESNLQKGLVFRWKLPYAPWPSNGITEGEIEDWIETCNKWKEKEPFPAPPNPYIPLATT